MSNGTVTDPRTQTEVHPDVVADYAKRGPEAAFWAPTGLSALPPPAGGGIPEAPADGQMYARQNGEWVVVPPAPQPGSWIPITFTNGTVAAECAYRLEPDGTCRLRGSVQAQSGNWGTVSVETLPLPASGTVYFIEGGLDDTGNNVATWQVMIWGSGAPTPGQLRLYRQLPDSGAGGTCSLDGIVYPC
jgi:hypothetical protein